MVSRKKKLTLVLLGSLVGMSGMATSAHATASQAFKKEFDTVLGVKLDHTYFCLDRGTACYSIDISGSGTGKSGGSAVSGTAKNKTYHQRCLARARASNSLKTVCGAASALYGVNGVCHQHTNRGQMSMHNTFMNPNNITGGWWSYAAYGPYGRTYAATCLPASTAQCAFSW